MTDVTMCSITVCDTGKNEVDATNINSMEHKQFFYCCRKLESTCHFNFNFTTDGVAVDTADNKIKVLQLIFFPVGISKL